MRVRWGFLGAGYVASRAMAPATHQATGATLFSVASRDAARSHALEPEVVHTDYAALINDPMVDAVYISLTNAQHAQWVTAALEAGKHVLCEKPLGLSAAEVREMFAVASRMNRLLVEASWVRWHPRFRRMEALIAAGDLGELISIDSAFTFVGDLTDNYRLRLEQGGGALLDVGCYQAQAWVAFTEGASEIGITDVERDIGPTGVDLTTRAHALIAGRTQATMLSSFALPARQSLVVSGTEFAIRTGEGEAFTSWRERSTLLVDSHVEHFDEVDAFVLMVENVSKRISGDDAWVVSLHDSIRCAEILETISSVNVSS